MKRTVIKYCLYFLIIINQGIIYPQQFDASVDKTRLGQNERFQVYFTFSDGDINKLRDFRPPDFKGFRILSGPNQSTSMQIINGRVSGSLTYSYLLQTQETGEFEIGGASVNYDGKLYNTALIKIAVDKASGSVGQGKVEGGISNEELAKNVFIVASADKRSVFKGEQIVVTYKLFTKLNISSPSIEKLPGYNGFWTEDLETSNNINFIVEMYEGERYRTAVIKKAALFPTKTGDLTITPFELNIPVLIKKQRTRRDIFDDFFNDSFFGRTETIDFLAKSNEIKIKVLPLPDQNVPDSFNGAVGQFSFSSSINKTEVETNESLTLKLKAAGRGNIELLKLPEIKVPAGFEKFDPKVNEKISRNDAITGFKEVEYLIVPRIPGSKEIPSIEFSYFDPLKKEYVSINTPAYNLSVAKGTGEYETSASGFTKEDIKLLSQDIRFIKTSSFDLKRKSEPTLFTLWFWISLIIPLIAFLTFAGIRNRKQKLSGNYELLKFQKAEKAARKRLKLAKDLMQRKDYQRFYAEISQALFGYLEDKLNIQKADFTIEKAVISLQNKNVDAAEMDELKKILEKCEFARFAPSADGESSAAEMYENAVKIIIYLENSISKKK